MAAMLSKVAGSRGLSKGGSACRFVVIAARLAWKCWCAGEAGCRPPQHEVELEEEVCWSCCVEGTNPRGEDADEDDAVAASKAMTRTTRRRATWRVLNASGAACGTMAAVYGGYARHEKRGVG